MHIALFQNFHRGGKNWLIPIIGKENKNLQTKYILGRLRLEIHGEYKTMKHDTRYMSMAIAMWTIFKTDKGYGSNKK